MWLFTPNGFLSIVADRDAPGRLLVRGRVRADVKYFCDAVGDGIPIETPSADYRWRVKAPATLVAEFVEHEALAIEYDNFKNEVAKRQGPQRAHAYLSVWAALRELED